jgi:hypothetical protein
MLSLPSAFKRTKVGEWAMADESARQSSGFYGRRIQMRSGFTRTLRVSLMMMYAGAKSSKINFENHGADFRRSAMRPAHDFEPLLKRAVKIIANNNV